MYHWMQMPKLVNGGALQAQLGQTVQTSVCACVAGSRTQGGQIWGFICPAGAKGAARLGR